MHGGTVETDPVARQSQRGRHRGQPAAAVPILQVGEQKWHRCRALLGRLAALRQQGRLSAGDLGDVEVLRQHRIFGARAVAMYPLAIGGTRSHVALIVPNIYQVATRLPGLEGFSLEWHPFGAES